MTARPNVSLLSPPRLASCFFLTASGILTVQPSEMRQTRVEGRLIPKTGLFQWRGGRWRLLSTDGVPGRRWVMRSCSSAGNQR